MQPTEETFPFLPLNAIMIYILQQRITVLESDIKTWIYEAPRNDFVIICGIEHAFPNMSSIISTMTDFQAVCYCSNRNKHL
jgi:hypothetical protein